MEEGARQHAPGVNLVACAATCTDKDLLLARLIGDSSRDLFNGKIKAKNQKEKKTIMEVD
jgi:hypothetical protein